MAKVKVILPGYTTDDAKANNGVEKTRPTISLVRDKNIVMICDPGILDSQGILIEALKKEGLTVDGINYVFITHSHLDHYRNIGLFKQAKTLEYFGIWDKETVKDWQENFTENLTIIKTPGHNSNSLTLLVKTNAGIIAVCGDVFWKENYPLVDPYASDPEKLKQSREKVLQLADYIIPGHAGMFKVKKTAG